MKKKRKTKPQPNRKALLSEKTFVLNPVLKDKADTGRSSQAGLEEIKNLTAAIDLTVVAAETVLLNRLNAALYIGKGAAERIRDLIKDNEITLAVVNTALSPIQQRNLEKLWHCKVIDRTALILEIFGERARTKEGVLQVELAHLSYQRSRLVRGWTHLERQRGGKGFLGGPGETQIELDRRVITDNIVKPKKELEEVKRTRHLHRKARQRVPFPVVALVGYTNAGKSTLFNRLTNADVFAKDMLFATLDPTMRLLKLPSGRQVILSDTVGFISDLPTELVAAFRATLEEVLEASLIIHVRDISHPDTTAQKADVENVLKALGVSKQVDQGLIEVLNKSDLMETEEHAALQGAVSRQDKHVLISAVTGEGIPELLNLLEKSLAAGRLEITADIPVADGAALAYLYRVGEVLERCDEDQICHVRVRLDPADAAKFKNNFPQVIYA
ncbi:MAG: GTPase HflX [Alphaproteobacteria bacterium]|nr:GTPase HflX [Alphaproteobacteria bacterium]